MTLFVWLALLRLDLIANANYLIVILNTAYWCSIFNSTNTVQHLEIRYFQETNVLAVHLTGALMAFGLGTVYAWIHTIMAYNMVPHINSKLLCHIRVVICSICTVTFIMSILLMWIKLTILHVLDICLLEYQGFNRLVFVIIPMVSDACSFYTLTS